MNGCDKAATQVQLHLLAAVLNSGAHFMSCEGHVTSVREGAEVWNDCFHPVKPTHPLAGLVAAGSPCFFLSG